MPKVIVSTTYVEDIEVEVTDEMLGALRDHDDVARRTDARQYVMSRVAAIREQEPDQKEWVSTIAFAENEELFDIS